MDSTSHAVSVNRLESETELARDESMRLTDLDLRWQEAESGDGGDASTLADT